MKKGMIKVSVLYPNEDGKIFDMDYYCNKHMPLVERLIGDTIKGAAVEKGLSGAAPDSPPPFIATANLYFDSLKEFEDSFGPNSDTLMADIPNYTNIEPVFLISEVII